MWQKLYAELKDRNFMVIAVAMDSRAGDPLPWIDAAKPEYLVLIDREHRLNDLYNLVNVPQAVWIDEGGRIVRPAESAGSYDGFRQMNRQTGQVPEEAAQLTAHAKQTYANAVRDWVLNGEASEHVWKPSEARARIPRQNENIALAHAMFRLGQYLVRAGRGEDGDRWLVKASALHPDSWCMWRQRAGVNDQGLAALPDFWARVEALGPRRYHQHVDMKGMP